MKTSSFLSIWPIIFLGVCLTVVACSSEKADLNNKIEQLEGQVDVLERRVQPLRNENIKLVATLNARKQQFAQINEKKGRLVRLQRELTEKIEKERAESERVTNYAQQVLR